jgi:hypothetical protein
LEEQRNQIYAKILDAKNMTADEVKVLGDALTDVNKQIAKIVRVSTPVNKLEIFETYMRNKFMGYNTTGRVLDTVSTAFLKNMRAALDPRIGSTSALAKSFAEVIPIYGVNYAAQGAATWTAVSLVGGGLFSAADIQSGGDLNIHGVPIPLGSYLMPLATSTSAVAAGALYGADIALNHLLRARAKKELDLIMMEFGAMQLMESLSDEDQIKVLSGALEAIAPLGLVAKGELFNKTTTVVMMLNHKKLKCPDGKTRSLRGAFRLNKEGTALEWNEEVYGSRASHGMELLGKDSKEMLKFRNEMEVGVKRVHGDYSDVLTMLKKRGKDFWNIFMFLRNYLAQEAILVWGDKWKDWQSGWEFAGMVGAPFAARAYRKAGQPVPHAYRQANKDLGFTVIIAAACLTAGLLIQKAADDWADLNEESVFQALNLNNRLWQDQTQLFNPNTFKQRSVTGISPHLASSYQAWGVLQAIMQALGDPNHNFREADRMTQREMVSNHLAEENDHIMTLEEMPHYNTWFKDVENRDDEYYLDMSGNVHSKYAQIDIEDAPSRTWFRFSRLLPGLSASKSQQNLKKAYNLSK